jgi:Arc/MetJ-type ribon-helix-helix transcriptional regulator
MQKRIIFRLPDAMYEQVAQAIKQGKAKTPSALIRQALEQFLKQNA